MAAPQDDHDEETNTPAESPRSLLPSTLASLISFGAATSSLSLRIGGFFGRTAINAARLGALGSIDLCRVLLENLLFNAGQDVIETSGGALGRAAAESLLDQALVSLHSVLTSTSYLVSTGFQIGSSSLAGALNISNAMITGIDAVLGDTETSKAIAAIVVLVQKEFGSPQTGVERVSLLDILVGLTAYALLQRWEYTRTEQHYLVDGVIENVWDVVILEDNAPDIDDTATLHEEHPVHGDDDARTDAFSRPMSVISVNGEMDQLDGPVATDDASSIISQRFGASQPEQQFRQRLSQSLKPGVFVRVSAQSHLKNIVTIEVDGDDSGLSDIEPPPGYTLVAVHRSQRRPQVYSYVFQHQRKRTRRGSFEIEHSRDAVEAGPGPVISARTDDVQSPTDIDLHHPEEGLHLAIGKRPLAGEEYVPDASASPQPIGPNQARTRIPLPNRVESFMAGDEAHEGGMYGGMSSPARVDTKKSSLKKSLKNNPSYNKLVEFWNHMPSTRPHRRIAQPHGSSSHRALEHGSSTPHRPASPQLRRSTTGGSFVVSRPSIELDQSYDTLTRPVSQRSQTLSLHRRGDSSVFSTAANASSLSLASQAGLHALDDASIPQQLNRSGFMAGQYPDATFAQNVTRFSRFANAAYGASFLRLTGATTSKSRSEADNTLEMHPSEHHSFTSHAGLPSSSVLLSSFVDPVGGAHSLGQDQAGLPLTHYVAIDHESKAVVVTLRGTLGFEDVLTDMTCDFTNVSWQGKPYYVHAGMLASARRLLTLHGSRLIATIKTALEEFTDYGLILCGHSLGGGVAALLAILIAEPNPAFSALSSAGDERGFVTASPFAASTSMNPADALAHTLPPGRPIHVYAYGPAAPMSPALSHVTRRLITTIINNNDVVPYLSLGNLRDNQRLALEFKHDTENAKAEVRRRVWQGLRRGLTSRAGVGSVESFWGTSWLRSPGSAQPEDDDDWPWRTLENLRSKMTAPKLVPPGEVFIIERRSALRRFAFGAEDSGRDGQNSVRSYQPATQVRVTYVRDVAERFRELRYAGSMFADHIPMRYEAALQALEKGVG